MQSIPRKNAGDHLFAEADAKYAMIKETLTSCDFQGKTDPEVERCLAVEQRELMRQLFQSFVTLRGQAEVQEPVVGADGAPRTTSATPKWVSMDDRVRDAGKHLWMTETSNGGNETTWNGASNMAIGLHLALRSDKTNA